MIMNVTKNLGRGLIIVASLVLVMLPLSATAQSTEDTTISVDVNSVLTAITTSDTVALGALTPNSTGTQSIAKDTVSVTTNDAQGFSLTLQDSDATRTLASGGNSFAAASGTAASPAALANNTWGWRVVGLSGFGAGATSSVNNGAPSSLTFAGIPANGSATQIKTTSVNGTDSVDVWYSARANNTQPSGTYTDTVTYTATTNP